MTNNRVNPQKNKHYLTFLFIILLFQSTILLSNPSNKKRSLYFRPPCEHSSLNQPSTSLPTEDKPVTPDTIRALHQKIIKEKRRIFQLNPLEPHDLPVAIGHNINGKDYDIIIHKIKHTPEGSFLTAYMMLEEPFSGKEIFFAGKDIRIKPTGFDGGARLELVNNVDIGLGAVGKLIIKGDEGKTFVNFDCNGYQSMGVHGLIEFDEKIIQPADSVQNKTKVTGEFATSLVGWHDFMAQISIDPFKVKKLEGFAFSVTDATFDFSDVSNASSMVFPEGYENTPLWRGFFLKDLTVRIPNKFNKNENTPTTISAQNLIIDENGFSGKFIGQNLITMDKGDMKGWKYSLQKLEVELIQSEFKSAGFNGEIRVPLEKEGNNTGIAYAGFIDAEGKYLFSGALTSNLDIDVPLLKAKLTINKGSNIEINNKNGSFSPKAVLNGKMTVSASGNAPIYLKDLTFQGLTIQSEAPIFDISYFGLNIGANSSLSKFPISIKKISFKKQKELASIGFNAAVNFTSSFSASAGFDIISDVKYENKKFKFKYKELKINQIAVDINQDAFSLKGSLDIYREDPIYGNGFKGMIDLTCEGGLRVAATGQFGSVNGMRYFYADALAGFGTGIPVFTGVGMFGFGGGIYYKMKREGASSSLPVTATEMTEDSYDPGKTLSGIKYVPDPKTFLGIKATVIIGTYPKPEPFNGDATFEIAFNNNWGINYLGFTGNGYFMKKVNANGEKAKVRASMQIDYLVPKKTLTGLFEAYVDIPNILEGTGQNKKAGSVEMFFSPDDWYIYIGKPDDRIGLKILKTIKIDSYFMVGTQIPGMPPIPDKVKKLAGGKDLDFMRNENALGNGSGFAFGGSLDIDTGDKTFLIFYGRFAAGMGFDVMLKNYGDAHCVGETDPIGINGWYASGQAYAYFQGKIGIKVKIFRKKIQKEILSIGAYAILQTKLPNPFWMKGYAGGYYNILGGLIKGKCDFEITVGSECEIEGGSVLDGIEVIAEAAPYNGAKDVNVFNAPQIAFNLAINKPFEIKDGNKVHTFRILLEEFTVKDNSDNAIVGNISWNDDNTVVILEPHDILPPQENLKLYGKVKFQEKINGNWEYVKDVEGEEVINSFKTGDAPNHIPESNIKYSYPLMSQVNFYKDEYNKGYIALKTGQPYLFNPGEEWVQKGRFTNGNKKLEYNISYNASTKTVNFTLPSGMVNEKIYEFKLVNVPASTINSLDENVSDVEEEVIAQGETTTEVTTKNIEGTLDLLEEQNLFETHFRTSKYSTFTNKMNAVTKEPNKIADEYYNGVFCLYTLIRGTELFDKFEIQDGEYYNKLIQAESYTNNKWFEKLNYTIYEHYPINNSLLINWRKTDKLGIPPIKDIFISQNIDNKTLSENDITSGTTSYSNIFGAKLKYDVSYSSYRDYDQLQNKYADHSLRNSKEGMKRLLLNYYPGVLDGNYHYGKTYITKTKLKYTLPGLNTTTSTYDVMIYQ